MELCFSFKTRQMLCIVGPSLRKLRGMRCKVGMYSCLYMCMMSHGLQCWKGKMSTLHEGWIGVNRPKFAGGECVTSTDGVDMAVG